MGPCQLSKLRHQPNPIPIHPHIPITYRPPLVGVPEAFFLLSDALLLPVIRRVDVLPTTILASSRQSHKTPSYLSIIFRCLGIISDLWIVRV